MLKMKNRKTKVIKIIFFWFSSYLVQYEKKKCIFFTRHFCFISPCNVSTGWLLPSNKHNFLLFNDLIFNNVVADGDDYGDSNSNSDDDIRWYNDGKCDGIIAVVCALVTPTSSKYRLCALFLYPSPPAPRPSRPDHWLRRTGEERSI